MLEDNLLLHKYKILSLKEYTKNFKVLLVEDYIPLQKSLYNIFSVLFGSVDVASDGLVALKLYKKDLYDIVFSDIAMPNMDGIELSKQIKRVDKNQIIVIFSAYQDSLHLKELINLGIKRFVSKPSIFKRFVR